VVKAGQVSRLKAIYDDKIVEAERGNNSIVEDFS